MATTYAIADPLKVTATPHSKKIFYYIGIVSLVFVFILLRLWDISKESLWWDEFFTAYCVLKSPLEIMKITAGDIHPPLYYLGLHSWSLLWGNTDLALRSYSTFWSLFAAVFVFALAYDIGGATAAFLAMLFVTANPHDIYFAQEARMYSQASALAVFGSFILWKWMTESEEWRDRRNFLSLVYSLSAMAVLFTHYTSILILLSQGLFALAMFCISRKWKDAVAYLACAAATAAVFIPWYVYVLKFRNTLYSPANLAWIEPNRITDLFAYLWLEFCQGVTWTSRNNFSFAFVPIPIILTGIGIFVWKHSCGLDILQRRTRLGILFLLSMMILPAALGVLASYVYYPIYFRPRFSLLLLPAFMALTGCLLARLSFKWRVTISVGLVSVFLAGTIQQSLESSKEDHVRPVVKAWSSYNLPPSQFYLLEWHDYFCISHYLSSSVVLPTERAIRRFETSMDKLKGKEVAVLWRKGCTRGHREHAIEFGKRLFKLGPSRTKNLPFDYQDLPQKLRWFLAESLMALVFASFGSGSAFF